MNYSDISKLIKAMDFVRENTGHRFEINQLRLVLAIYEGGDNGKPLVKLAEETGLNPGSMSRSVGKLSTAPTKGTGDGYGFCEKVFDPRYPKERVIVITKDGKRFVERILKILEK